MEPSMKSDKFFAADPARLPELALASDCLCLDRSSAGPDAALAEHQPSPAAAAVRPGRRIGALVARMAKWFFVAVYRSQQRRAVTALSDNLLRDIGLTRDDFMHRTRIRGPRD
jgi:uncharacterized protein YjiS (DUF1127 family)